MDPSESQADDAPFRERVSKRSGEALGEVAQALMDNPLFSQALHAAGEARDRAVAARRTAMGALDVSAAGDVDRLERRLRALADRLEEVEDAVDHLTGEIAELRKTGKGRGKSRTSSTSA